MHAVTENSPSSAHQRSIWWSGCLTAAVCFVASRKRMKCKRLLFGWSAFVLVQVEIVAVYRPAPLSLLLEEKNADEISGELSHQEQTAGHHLYEVAVLTEKLWESGARQINGRQCDIPAVWQRILSFYILNFIQLWLLIHQTLIERGFFLRQCFSLNTGPPNVKNSTWLYVF